MTVATCGQCGERSPAGAEFCGGCGAFLAWVVETPVPPPAPDPPPVAPDPVVRRPDEPAHRPRTVLPEEPPPPAAGETPCRSCGTGNGPTRRFCRSCGAPLTEAAPPVRRAGWRRWFARRVYAAGERRRAGLPVRWWPPALLLVAVLLLLVGLSMPPVRQIARGAVDEVRDRTSTHVPVTPVAARSSSSMPGAGPEHVFDGVSDAYWAPAGAAVGAWVEVDFAQPIRLLDVVVTAGVSTDQARFLARCRPQELAVTVTTPSGAREPFVLRLRDAPGGQRFPVKLGDTVRVRFDVRSVSGPSPERGCALGELEFFARGQAPGRAAPAPDPGR